MSNAAIAAQCGAWWQASFDQGPKVGGTSHYHLDGLFSKLEAQKRQDERAQVKVADAG